MNENENKTVKIDESNSGAESNATTGGGVTSNGAVSSSSTEETKERIVSVEDFDLYFEFSDDFRAYMTQLKNLNESIKSINQNIFYIRRLESQLILKREAMA